MQSCIDSEQQFDEGAHSKGKQTGNSSTQNEESNPGFQNRLLPELDNGTERTRTDRFFFWWYVRVIKTPVHAKTGVSPIDKFLGCLMLRVTRSYRELCQANKRQHAEIFPKFDTWPPVVHPFGVREQRTRIATVCTTLFQHRHAALPWKLYDEQQRNQVQVKGTREEAQSRQAARMGE